MVLISIGKASVMRSASRVLIAHALGTIKLAVIRVLKN